MDAKTGIGLAIAMGVLALGLVHGEDLPEDPIPVEGNSIVDDADPIGSYEPLPVDPQPVKTPRRDKDHPGGKDRSR
jgi:hypothetical protein